MSFLRRLFKDDGLPQDRTEEILRRHLDGDFIVFPMADSTATRADVERIAKRYSVTFPQQFVGHVCGRFSGIYVEVNEGIWPRPRMYEVGPFWSFLYGLHTFTPCVDSNDWMRLDIAASEFQEHTGLRCAPILKIVDDADVYCVDEAGAIARYHHDTNTLSPETADFWTVFEREIAQLKGRKMRKVAGRA